MQNILNVGEIKVYSRREVIAWIENGQVYKYSELKNGLFFLKVLKKLVPNDIAKIKIYEKPANAYECTQNMTAVKKVLNKHNLQMNLDIPAVVAAKNGFELANWFKNLYDSNTTDRDSEFTAYEKSYTPSKNSSKEIVSPNAKLSRAISFDVRKSDQKAKTLIKVTSGFINIHNVTDQQFYKSTSPKQVKLNSQLYYNCRSNRQNQKMVQNYNSQLFDKNTLQPQPMKTQRKSKSKSKSKSKGVQAEVLSKKQNNNYTMNCEQIEQEQYEEENEFKNLLKKEALASSISSYENILGKIAAVLPKNGEEISMEELKAKVKAVIYMQKV